MTRMKTQNGLTLIPNKTKQRSLAGRSRMKKRCGRSLRSRKNAMGDTRRRIRTLTSRTRWMKCFSKSSKRTKRSSKNSKTCPSNLKTRQEATPTLTSNTLANKRKSSQRTILMTMKWTSGCRVARRQRQLNLRNRPSKSPKQQVQKS